MQWATDPRRRRNCLRVAAAAGAGLIAVFLIRPAEPVYQGRPVSAWVEELAGTSYPAAAALHQLGPAAVSPLVRALESKPSKWPGPVETLSRHAPGFLRSRLADACARAVRRNAGIPRLRTDSAQVLGDLGPVAFRAAPALVRALTDADPILRRNAAFALGKIGARPDLAVPALCARLRDTDDDVRMYAAIALKKFGGRAAAAVPALASALRDPSWKVRERAALALGTTGRGNPKAVDALERAMFDEHRFVRSSAATALAWLAPQAGAARDALEQARYDPDAEVRYSAGLAVSQIDAVSGPDPAFK